MSNKNLDLKEDIGSRGNKLAEQYIKEPVIYSLRGDFGQALLVTNVSVYVLKWGFQTGLTFGGRCTPYSYANITAVQVEKKLTSRFIEIITPGNQDKRLNYWASRGHTNNAIEAPNAVTFPSKSSDKFQAIVNFIQDKITHKQHVGDNRQTIDIADQLEKLALLKQKGILTQDEFDSQKKKLLNKD